MWQRLSKGQSAWQWLREIVQFCIVGGASYVVDVGLFNILAYSGWVSLPGDASMVAKTLSAFVSIIFSWVVNRHWTFRGQSSRSAPREFVAFLAVNIGGLLIALACLGFSRYVLHLTSQLADNISANVVGLILGTLFRYVCYRYAIFTAASGVSPQQ